LLEQVVRGPHMRSRCQRLVVTAIVLSASAYPINGRLRPLRGGIIRLINDAPISTARPLKLDQSYGITQDLDYLNTVIGTGQEQVKYLWNLPYYGEICRRLCRHGRTQTADDNKALAAIVSNITVTAGIRA
jgi:hypothetical protein